jgi:hypothetical protein
MRHFAAYHNAEKMKYSCTAIPEPRVKTLKPVASLEGVTVWLIAGEGKSPKRFYLTIKFIAKKCQSALYPGTEFPNQISGEGELLGLSIPLNGTPLLEALRTNSLSFRKGFYEIKCETVVKGLQSLVP